MASDKEPKIHGPAIDGIEEYDNPLPGWWLMLFYISIAFAVVYWFIYPSWFGKGMFNWSQNTDWSEEVELAKTKYPVKVINVNDFVGKQENIDIGKQIFQQNCVACHGPEAKGLIGPNLTDSIWIHGGKPEDIVNTITKGVAAKGMPTWGPVLGPEKIANVTSFIISLYNPNQPSPSGAQAASAVSASPTVPAPSQGNPAPDTPSGITNNINFSAIIGNKEHIEKGKQIFATNCVACHGQDAKSGKPGLIGPDLTDNVWIHGGTPEQIHNSVTNGVPPKGMPTWGPILGPEKVGDAVAFIYSLSHPVK